MICDKGDCKKNYLLLFTADWCLPCKRLYPTIEKLRKDGYIVYVLDADKYVEAKEEFEVKSLPTLVVMNDGKEVKRFVGVTGGDTLRENLKTRVEQDADKPDTPDTPDNGTDYNFL
jgi:thioredoxin 1